MSKFMETFSCIVCLLFFFVNLVFRLSVILSFQLELWALSLGPKARSASLCREHFRCPGVLTLALRGQSALPKLIKHTAIRALKWQRGKGREWNQEIIQMGFKLWTVSSPFFHSWGFGCVSLGLFSTVTLAACDLLTVLQTFPHSGRFDVLFILFGSPESLSVRAKPAFVYNFSGNFHRAGGKTALPPHPVFYF